MNRLPVLVGFLALAAIVIADVAFAQTSDTTISVGGIWRSTVEPLIVTAISGFVAGLLTWIATIFQKATNIKVEDAWRQSIHSAAMTGVTAAMAKIGTKVDGLTIDVKYKIVKEAADWMMRSVPDALKGLGLDKAPDKLNELILSKIGLLEQTPATVEAAKTVPNA